MTTHEVQISAEEAERVMLSNHVLWQSIERVDRESCLVVTEDQDSDALTGGALGQILAIVGIEKQVAAHQCSLHAIPASSRVSAGIPCKRLFTRCNTPSKGMTGTQRHCW